MIDTVSVWKSVDAMIYILMPRPPLRMPQVYGCPQQSLIEKGIGMLVGIFLGERCPVFYVIGQSFMMITQANPGSNRS